MLKIEYHRQFKKDFQLALKRGCNQELLANVVSILASEKPLPAKYRDLALSKPAIFNTSVNAT